MDDSKQEIMEATCAALEKHGYTELSVQRIADEFDKSKSLLYHHYDGKDEILLDLMEFILEKYRDQEFREERRDTGDNFREEAFKAFREEGKDVETFVELRTESLRDERFREKFEKFREAHIRKLAALLEEKSVPEPERKAKFITAINNEAMFRKAAGEDVEDLRSELEDYLERFMD
ncbi:MAG: TetR/AcrR family transcriptional regulator [Candidatus Nanohalobium sp.]